jgi:tRNA (guanine-N7-)-methyltransferase
MSVPPPERLIHSYGRRRGRPLRKGRASSHAELLPKISIAPPRPSETLEPRGLFAPPVEDVWLEIGFGGGEHLAAQAQANPAVGLIGCEPYVNGMAALLARVEAQSLSNLRVWPGDAREIIPSLPDASIGRAFVLFADPWPKTRHHKRRLITPGFLDSLARILRIGAELRLASDDPGYLDWMLERAPEHAAFSWTARVPDDWRVRPADWPATRYEEKAIAAGRKPYFLRFVRK